MANTKISQLSTASSPLTGNELALLVQSGDNVTVPVNNLIQGAIFQNLAAIQATAIPSSVNNIECLSYINPGDLFGYKINYKRISGLPSSSVTIAPTNTVTISIATPGVITWAAHYLPAGSPVIFSSTGTLPTGLVSGTTYYVSYDGNYSWTAFAVAATQADALAGINSIAMTGTQSGVQTCVAPTTVIWLSNTLYSVSKVQFTTTGSLPSGLSVSTPYYISLLPNTTVSTCRAFQVTATLNGTPIDLSGVQSGTQTCINLNAPGYLRSSDTFLPNGSNDNVEGGYWKISNSKVTPQMFGAPTVGTSGYDDYPAFRDALAFIMNDWNYT